MLYGECRGESQFGKLCVASTVMNRLELAKTKGITWWGVSVQTIIKAPMQYQGLVLENIQTLTKSKSLDWIMCKQVSIAVLDFGIVVPDITHFSGIEVDLEYQFQRKNFTYKFDVGNHNFYQEEY
jgi:hypothetical protein